MQLLQHGGDELGALDGRVTFAGDVEDPRDGALQHGLAAGPGVDVEAHGQPRPERQVEAQVGRRVEHRHPGGLRDSPVEAGGAHQVLTPLGGARQEQRPLAVDFDVTFRVPDVGAVRDESGPVAVGAKPPKVPGELAASAQVKVGLEAVEGDVRDPAEQLAAAQPAGDGVAEQCGRDGPVGRELEAAAGRRLHERPGIGGQVLAHCLSPRGGLLGVVGWADGQGRLGLILHAPRLTHDDGAGAPIYWPNAVIRPVP